MWMAYPPPSSHRQQPPSTSEQNKKGRATWLGFREMSWIHQRENGKKSISRGKKKISLRKLYTDVQLLRIDNDTYVIFEVSGISYSWQNNSSHKKRLINIHSVRSKYIFSTRDMEVGLTCKIKNYMLFKEEKHYHQMLSYIYIYS